MYFFPSQNPCPGYPESRSSVKDSKPQQFRIGQRHESPIASAGSARQRHGETPKRSAIQFQVAPVSQATERGDQLFGSHDSPDACRPRLCARVARTFFKE